MKESSPASPSSKMVHVVRLAPGSTFSVTTVRLLYRGSYRYTPNSSFSHSNSSSSLISTVISFKVSWSANSITPVVLLKSFSWNVLFTGVSEPVAVHAELDSLPMDA